MQRTIVPAVEIRWRRPTPVEAAVDCFALFAATVLVMPFIKDGYVVRQTISEGAVGDLGWVQALGLLALAGGSLLVARLLMHAGMRMSAALITASACCVVVLVVFPTDAGDASKTLAGRVHYLFASVAFLAIIAAMLWSARAFRGDVRLRHIAMPSVALGMTSAILLAALAIDVEPRGVVQRGAAMCNVAWLATVTLRLRPAGSGADDAAEADV